MKIAIFGYPRSGTTMLHNLIAQHLVAAGVVEPWASIGEAFNPLEGTRLQVTDGHLVNVNTHFSDIDPPQKREERLRLFQKYTHHDYITKMLPYDIELYGLPATVQDAGYRIIAIERRNPLSAFLSVIIAYQHWVWHAYGNEQPVYEPFEVPTRMMQALGKSFSIYYHHRDTLEPTDVLYYEDIVMNSVESTLKELGLHHEGIPTEGSPTKKLQFHLMLSKLSNTVTVLSIRRNAKQRKNKKE